MTLLSEIGSGWHTEAKSEDSSKYFFFTSETDKILKGEANYIIGRKGTGKTAISEHITKLSKYNAFCEKLTFKNFPFNEMYGLINSSFTAPNQYITIWKYIIYRSICKKMVENQSIDSEVRQKLGVLFEQDANKGIARWLKKWTAATFGVSILGCGFNIGRTPIANELSWVEKVDILEDIILEYIDDSTYYIVFDELDEDYKGIVDRKQYDKYTQLLTGLFKAAQDIISIGKQNKLKIHPVIFLRDDIYSLIKDNDKTKWDDLKIDISWDIEKIKGLLAFRISRALDVEEMPFNDAWHKLFSREPIQIGHRQQKSMSIFDYITRNTHQRPRDYVKYIKICAGNSPSTPINAHKVTSSENNFSVYLKGELTDEIHSVISEIDCIFDILSQIRKQSFQPDEFRQAFAEKIQDGSIVDQRDPDFVLKVLYIFSVIGNQPRQLNRQIFRFNSNNSNLNPAETIIVHRGLYKSLQIF